MADGIKPTVWHVGRTGNVAGGMTQVVNGYLGWTFENSDVRVIVSRDGSTGLRAIARFAAAVATVMRIPSPRSAVVVVHLSQGGSFIREGLLLRLAKRRGTGTVAQLHGSSFAAFAARRPRLVRRVLAAASRVMTLSEESHDVASRLVPSARVVRLPNAVASGNPAAKSKTVVFGGSVSHRKGVDILMQSWRGIADHGGWRLIVAGPVADPGVVDAALADVELRDVDFVGAVEHSRLMALLDEASIAVLPSRDEAMPMFILEAMARGACVIASTVGGIPQVLDGGAGLLVEPGDVASLTAALDRAMSDEPFRDAVARRGNARFLDEFSAEAVYPRVEECWLEALPARA